MPKSGRPLAKRTDSLPAYDCLLRGVQHLRGYGADDNRLARELFEKAVALDPRYALAHAYLALSLMVENGYGGAPDAIKQRALDIATAAVRMDPRESRCHTFLGQVYRFRDEYDLAISTLNAVWNSTPTTPSACFIWPLCSVSPAVPKRVSK